MLCEMQSVSSGFELVSPCPFPTAIMTTPRAPLTETEGEAPILEIRSENCGDKVAQRTNRILRVRNSCTHSKMELCF